MGNDAGDPVASGTKPAGKTPGTTLRVLVSVEDAPWADIPPEHGAHALFAWARDHQDSWDARTFAGFWQAAFPLLPRRRGNRSHAGLRGRWMDRWRSQGYTDAQIAEALGYPLDTLSRAPLGEAIAYRRWHESHPLPDTGRTRALREAIASDGRVAPELVDDVIRKLCARPRLPRVVTTDEETFAVGRESFSYAALGESERRHRAAELALVQRTDDHLRRDAA